MALEGESVKSLRASLLRLALVVALGCLGVSIAKADDIGTLYTGTFSVATQSGTVWQPWLSQVTGSLLGNTQTLEYSMMFSAPITDFQVTPPCGPDCPQYFYGDLNSGTLSFSGMNSFGQHPYNFSGAITPGGFITGETFCDAFGCEWLECVSMNFTGEPSNGWQSAGEVILNGGNDGSQGGDSGVLKMVTTPTPEPGSIFLLGIGIVGLARASRYKLKP
jgi:hypothetical protein